MVVASMARKEANLHRLLEAIKKSKPVEQKKDEDVQPR